MLKYFNKGEILKGSACDITVLLFPCGISSGSVSDFTCEFYTESGQSIQKGFDDFEFDGRYGTVHFESAELDSLADGVVRYTARYFIDPADWYTLERASGFYLKTPVNYTPIDFVTRDELDEAVVSAMTSSSVTVIIEDVVSSMTSALTTEIVKLRIPFVLPSSGAGIQSSCEKAWNYFEQYKEDFVVPYTANLRGRIDMLRSQDGWFFRVIWGDIVYPASKIDVYFLQRTSNGIYILDSVAEKTMDSWVWFDKYATSADTVSALTALEYEVSTKQDELVSGTNIKTINGQSILGSGNIDIQGGSGGTDYSKEIEALSGVSSAHTEQISSLSASTSENTSKIAQISASTQNLETVVASKGNVSSDTINKIWTGTRAQYSAQTIYSTTLYIITD